MIKLYWSSATLTLYRQIEKLYFYKKVKNAHNCRNLKRTTEVFQNQ